MESHELLGQPNATYSEDFYRFHWANRGIDIALERFSDARDDVRCEATITLDHNLYGGRLYSGRLLLIGPNSRRDVRKELELRTGGESEEFDWGGILEQVCNLARERYRRGEPPVDLTQVDFRERPQFLLEPFIVRNGISIPYGDGGTSKSMFALRWCVQLAEQGIRSLYLDWEDDKETHAERLLAVANGMEVEVKPNMIFYQRRTVPLVDSVRETKRYMAEQGIEHVVVDSAGMAAGDPNDHGKMIEMVRGARALEVAATLIHHLPKDAKDKSKPFGSVYASNEARITWLIEKAQEEGSDEIATVWTNHKFNRGRMQPKRAYRVRFVNDGDLLLSVQFEETEVGQVQAFRSKLPQRQLIGDVLKRNGMLSARDISDSLMAEGVELSANIIGAVLRRYRGKLFVQQGEKWGYLDSQWTPEHVREQ